MLNKLKSATTLLSLTFALCTITYASPVNQVASSIHLTSPAENTEQYKITVNTDDHMSNPHVEILPNDDGEYWIPKGYKVNVTADCDEGYEQKTNASYTINESKTIKLSSGVAPPSKVDLLEDELNDVKTRLTTLEQNRDYTIDTSNLIATFEKDYDTMDIITYTATQDCFIVVAGYAMRNMTSYMYIDGVCVNWQCVQGRSDGYSTTADMFYCKKGQTIKTRDDGYQNYIKYEIKVYGVK